MPDDKPILYLLKRDFRDPAYPGKTFFCPFCLRLEGLLALYPQVRHATDVRYVGFNKPRGELAEFAGDDSQSCPQIIIQNGDDDCSKPYSAPGLNGVRRIDSTDHIIQYLIERFGLSDVHP